MRSLPYTNNKTASHVALRKEKRNPSQVFTLISSNSLKKSFTYFKNVFDLVSCNVYDSYYLFIHIFLLLLLIPSAIAVAVNVCHHSPYPYAMNHDIENVTTKEKKMALIWCTQESYVLLLYIDRCIKPIIIRYWAVMKSWKYHLLKRFFFLIAKRVYSHTHTPYTYDISRCGWTEKSIIASLFSYLSWKAINIFKSCDGMRRETRCRSRRIKRIRRRRMLNDKCVVHMTRRKWDRNIILYFRVAYSSRVIYTYVCMCKMYLSSIWRKKGSMSGGKLTWKFWVRILLLLFLYINHIRA